MRKILLTLGALCGLFLLWTAPAQAQQEAIFPLSPSHCAWINVPGSPYHINFQLYALDLNCSDGKEDFGAGVYAILPGVVYDTGSTPTCGNFVDVFHSQYNLIAHTCHLNDVMIAKGAPVNPGTILGHVGTTGGVPSHLHFSLIRANSNGSWPVDTSSASAFNTASIPAFANIGSVSGNYSDPGVGFITSNPGTVPTLGKLDLEVDWPKMPFIGQTLNSIAEGSQPIYLNNIVQFIFRISLWLASILAFVSIIYAGFAYIISGANPGERAKAIQRIRSVVIGTAILLTSITLLNFLNPSFVALELENNPTKQGKNLIAPTAPTGGTGQLFNDTQNHEYGPIPFTNRLGTESAYELIVDQAEKVKKECQDNGGGFICDAKYEETIISLIKQQAPTGSAAYVLADDGEAPPASCAAICMYVAQDSKNCRAQTSNTGGAAKLWDKIKNISWLANNKGIYPDKGIDDDWLRGDENLASRSCLAQYVSSATDAPGNYGWDACFCKTQ